jgi:predicted extracellular nuclease
MKLRLIILLNILFLIHAQLIAQSKICISFYNQENLFDTLDTPNKDDSEFLPQGTYAWNSEKYFNKLNNMSAVITQINQGKGPDFIGMCEVESHLVVDDLTKTLSKTGKTYQYIWHDSKDERGIDNALLYKKEWVQSVQSKLFDINPDSIGGSITRGLLMADFTLKNQSRLVIFVNHWPSRRGGETESEPKRIYVASYLKHLCDSIQKKDPKVAIVLMGDFNDHPNNISISNFLKAKESMQSLDKNDFYNPMYALMKEGKGSYNHRGNWNFLDQFMLNQNLLSGKGKLKYLNQSAQVFKEEFMLETEEKYKGNPKRTFGGKKYLNGYSDHLPIYMYLQLD